ncbi:unnamed protein product [Cercospora beticola]|nr:unnamed protein product [Cercospora beticola]
MHVDCNSEKCILVFDYFQDTLLSLLNNNPSLSPDERPKIMRSVGEAVNQLHSRDWVHSDIKPDNVFVNWTSDQEGNKVITKTVLGDFDIACKLKDGETRITPHAVGNVMWRSPEAQACMANKATDIYSLGLVAFQSAAEGADAEVKERPEMRMEYWTQELGASTFDLLSQLTNLDPRARPNITDVLAHPYWKDSLPEH